MWHIRFGMILLSLNASLSYGFAQETAHIQDVADMMVRLCLASGHSEATTGGASAGADVSLRSFDLRGNLKGDIRITRSRAEGLVNGIDNALNQVAADQADKVRACLQPVRERLLDVMLPHSNRGAAATTAPSISQTTHGASSPAISGVHGNVTITTGH